MPIFLEGSVYIATKDISTLRQEVCTVDLLRITVTGDDAMVDALHETAKLPRSGATLGMTAKALLRHDRDGVAWAALEVVEDIVPDVCFVGFVGTRARTMNRKHSDVVRRQAPDCECTPERCDARIAALKHAVCRKSFLLLARSFGFHVRDPGREVRIVNLLALALAEFELIAEKFLLVCKPLSNLLATEGQLTRAILDVEDRKGMFRSDFTSN